MICIESTEVTVNENLDPILKVSLTVNLLPYKLPYSYSMQTAEDDLAMSIGKEILSQANIDFIHKRQENVYVWFSKPNEQNIISVAATDHEHMCFVRTIGSFQSRQDALAEVGKRYPNKQCIIMNEEN